MGFVMVVAGSNMSCEVRLKVIDWFFGLMSIVWEPILHWLACCKGTDIYAFGAKPSNLFLPIVCLGPKDKLDVEGAVTGARGPFDKMFVPYLCNPSDVMLALCLCCLFDGRYALHHQDHSFVQRSFVE
jgi:hypothetical protein